MGNWICICNTTKHLTIGKLYFARVEYSKIFSVIDDNGNQSWVDRDFFISIKSHRNMKIKKILDEGSLYR